jgi:hypothetical protein
VDADLLKGYFVERLLAVASSPPPGAGDIREPLALAVAEVFGHGGPCPRRRRPAAPTGPGQIRADGTAAARTHARNPDTARVRDAVIRVYDRDPDSDDADDMYVLDVFGLSVLVRLRAGDPDDPDDPDSPYVHIDNENRGHGPLAVEVCSAGETDYRI